MAVRNHRQLKSLKNLLKLTDDRDPEMRGYAVRSLVELRDVIPKEMERFIIKKILTPGIPTILKQLLGITPFLR